jgi:hypothetical protein
MVRQGVFTGARSFPLDGILYYVTAHRVGDEYQVHWQCARCDGGRPEEIREPVISRYSYQAMDAARQQAEEHHRQQHGRNARTLATTE